MQVYLAFEPHNESAALARLEACLQEVRIWMAKNSLKLNDSKTDFIMFGTKNSLQTCTTSHITIGEAQVKPSDYVKNIGANMDKYLKLDKHVNLACKSAWFNLYQLGKLKRYLSEKQLKSVMQAFVISKHDMI